MGMGLGFSFGSWVSLPEFPLQIRPIDISRWELM